MNILRIWAIILRYTFIIFKNVSGVFNIIYWPILNIIIWGTTSSWIQKHTLSPNMIMIIITGLILWQIVFRVNIEISKSLLDEISTNNLINLYSTPLTVTEWLIGLFVVGIIQMLLVFFTSSAAAYALYSVNIFSLGFILVPMIISLLISGWSIGLFICGLLMLYGKKIQDFIYSIGWVFAPFSAIYYSVSTLPLWMQKISFCLPMTYIFEAAREVIIDNNISIKYILISYALNCLYLALSVTFFMYTFHKSKDSGLIKID